MTRLYIKWFFSVLLLLAAQIVGLIVVPVALLHLRIRDRKYHFPLMDRLPRWAQAWDNEGDTFGDRYWVAAYGFVAAQSFWTRVHWLALRNRAHNLSAWLGVGGTLAYHKEYKGRSNIHHVPDDSRAWTGRLMTEAYDAGFPQGGAKLRAFEYYGVLPYPQVINKTLRRVFGLDYDLGIRYRLGWKIKGGKQEDTPHRLVVNVMHRTNIKHKFCQIWTAHYCVVSQHNFLHRLQTHLLLCRPSCCRT